MHHLWSILFLLCLATAGPVATVSADSVPGVVGDGVADDTAAIQRAVDSGQGSLRFARGIYRLTNTITVDLDRVGWSSLSGDGVAQFRMDAPGPAFRFVGTHDGTASPTTVKPNVWERQRSPMIDGIEVLGGHGQACGIEAEGTMQLTLTRLVVRKVKHAVRLTGRNRNVTLSECHLYENSGIGVFLDKLNLHQINIANCHISYNAGGGIVARGSEIRNLQVGTCDIEGNMGDASSEPTANILLDSTGTSVGEVAIVGCTIQHTHDAPDSANIRINGLSTNRPFTEELRSGNITIANNVLSDVQTNIDLQNVRGVTVSGNTLWKGYSANLTARHCAQLVMTGNLYDRNPRYHYGDGDTAKLGVILSDCSDLTISGEHYGGAVNQAADIQLRRCEAINITGCSFSSVSRVAILLEDVQFGRVSDCLITGTGKDAVDFRTIGKNDVVMESNRFR
jgi:hypothetical protein